MEIQNGGKGVKGEVRKEDKVGAQNYRSAKETRTEKGGRRRRKR